MTITFVGHGYVGLVSAAIFADLGNTVWVIGHTRKKIENLKKGIIPIYEPGLEELVRRNIKAKRLLFALDYTPSISLSDVVFIAVGTPPKDNGEADLSTVFEVAEKVGRHLDGYTVVITKSTVPIGTNQKVKKIIDKVKNSKVSFDIASVPEFLREGQAIEDTMHPDRIIIGTENPQAKKLLMELHKPIDGTMMLCNIETAEMIKYASNAFLATKISFANAIARLSELTGADGGKVLEAVGLDRRVGNLFLDPGAGYGGSCFPKDVKALIAIAKQHKYDFNLLREVEAINREAQEGIVKKALSILGRKPNNKSIAVLGLSFKPDTDDMRDAPSITVVRKLLPKVDKIKVYDPVSMVNAKEIFSKDRGIVFSSSAYEAVENTDLLIIMTEWNEFRQLDLLKIKKTMRDYAIVDGRNIYDPEKVRELGFKYIGVGR